MAFRSVLTGAVLTVLLVVVVVLGIGELVGSVIKAIAEGIGG